MTVSPTFSNMLSRFGINLTQTTPPASQTPINPGTIVNTSGTTWDAIPTAVKIGGAALLAFIGYKKFLAPKKSSGVSGLRGLFGGRRRRR